MAHRIKKILVICRQPFNSHGVKPDGIPHRPHSVCHSAAGFYRFASEPLVSDPDRVGFAEVIFTSWVQEKTSAPVRLNMPYSYSETNVNGDNKIGVEEIVHILQIVSGAR